MSPARRFAFVNLWFLFGFATAFCGPFALVFAWTWRKKRNPISGEPESDPDTYDLESFGI
jgi:hypothetical protein